MSLLSVSAIENTASPTTNIVVNADGSVTIGLYRAGTAPTPVQTGTLWYDQGGVSGTTGVVIWNGAAWVGVGGGAGTVTGVTASLPLVSSGGAAPNLTINAATTALPGSMSAADKTKLDGAATIVSSVTGTLPITVATGTSTPVIAINAATNAAAGSIEIATLAEAATGTDATRASTPETAVPKDAAGMTGAALIPGGVDGGRPSSPSGGMFRYNTTYTPDTMEYYDGTATSWKRLVNYDQLALVAIDGYSTTVNGLVANDLPLIASPLALTWIDIPAGYTNFFVTTSFLTLCAYNTTGQPAAQPYNQTTYGPAPGPSNANQISEQSVVYGSGADFQGTGMVVSGAGSVGGLNPATAYSVGIYSFKGAGGGQIQVYDCIINVLAWNVNP